MTMNPVDDEPQAKRMKLDQSVNQSACSASHDSSAQDEFNFNLSMFQSDKPLDPSTMYLDQSMLAPMVRLNTLPFRLLCRQYGCKVLYSEELIAQKVSICSRSVRTVKQSNNQTVDLIEFTPAVRPGQHKPDHQVPPTFSTYSGEPVVLQLGASCGVSALAAASVLINDVVAVDLNMGCPEKFSTSGGMGSALLSQPERVADILSTLRRNLSTDKPVTCKIRMLEDERATVELMRRAEHCGVAAIGVHARYIHDRPMKVRAMTELVKPLVDCVSVPIIYNGDCFTPSDIVDMKRTTGCSSVMVARGAMWNASIFGETMLPVYDVARRYQAIASVFGPGVANTKYCLLEMIKPHISRGQAFSAIAKASNEQAVTNALSQLRLEATDAMANAAIPAFKNESYRRFLHGPYQAPVVHWEARPPRKHVTSTLPVTNDSVVAVV